MRISDWSSDVCSSDLLERLTAEGQTLIERRNAFELMRDQAAEHYERHTGSNWRPRSGSMVNHRNLTSAMIDSRDFLAAKKRADNAVDRKSVVKGKSVSVRVDSGGRSIIKKNST